MLDCISDKWGQSFKCIFWIRGLSLDSIYLCDGRFIKELNRIYPEKTFKGVDVSRKAIALAKAMNPDLDFEANEINCLKGRYDVILLIEVIEHIAPSDLESFIRSTASLLKQGGFLILTTPSINKKLSRKHFQHFTPEILSTLLDSHYRINKMHYLHNINHFYKILLKSLYNKYIILNYQPLLSFIFRYYYQNLFIDITGRGHRLYVVAERKQEKI